MTSPVAVEPLKGLTENFGTQPKKSINNLRFGKLQSLATFQLFSNFTFAIFEQIILSIACPNDISNVNDVYVIDI